MQTDSPVLCLLLNGCHRWTMLLVAYRVETQRYDAGTDDGRIIIEEEESDESKEEILLVLGFFVGCQEHIEEKMELMLLITCWISDDWTSSRKRLLVPRDRGEQRARRNNHHL